MKRRFAERTRSLLVGHAVRLAVGAVMGVARFGGPFAVGATEAEATEVEDVEESEVERQSQRPFRMISTTWMLK